MDLIRPMGRMAFLVSVLLVSLLLVSWVATMIGIMHLAQTEGSGWDLAVWILVGGGSLVITGLMWVMLERSRLPGSALARTVCGVFYVFLLLWAVGFGYSFWWSAIASRSSSTESITAVLTTLDRQLEQADGKLRVVADQLTMVANASGDGAAEENMRGSTCGAISSVGQGPLWGARQSINRAITAKIDGLQKGWILRTRNSLDELKASRARIADQSSGWTSERRNTEFTAMYEAARFSAERINSENAAVARTTAAELDSFARRLSIPQGQPGFECYDPSLATSLRATADEVRQPIVITIPPWRAMEGKKSTEVAFTKLWGTLLSPFLPAGGERMVGRDWIAFLAAIAVDIGILVLTLIRPRAGGQTFMSDEHADSEARSQLERILRRHRKAALLAFYDMHFSMGRRQYVAIPDTHWIGSQDPSSRDFHVAMGALSPRLAATRLTNPSSRLLALAAERLSRAGWSPHGKRIKDERVGGWKEWLAGLTKGSVMPNHPLIFEIGEQDRNLAIRLLDEAEQNTPPSPPHPTPTHLPPPFFDNLETDVSQREEIEREQVDLVVDEDWVNDLYAAAVSQRQRGLEAEADGIIRIIRRGLPKLAAEGIDVIGLDGVVGQPFNPKDPFAVISQEPSAAPRGTVLEVSALALARTTDAGRRILKDGQVIVSSGPRTRSKPSGRAKASADKAGLDFSDPLAWMPGDQ